MRNAVRSELHVSDSWVISQGMKRMMLPLRESGPKDIPIVSATSHWKEQLLTKTDNSISLLYSQPISALQILTPQGEWKWVKHVEGSVVVNTADALECEVTYPRKWLMDSPDRRCVQSDPTQGHQTTFRSSRYNPIYPNPLCSSQA
jgi:hypothetical protein